ncbi:MAG: STM4015 family protein [Candidatus Melainabacteria bacterium]|nr:STM4015 family protein [Candidatus Melainabacteria bacterium]
MTIGEHLRTFGDKVVKDYDDDFRITDPKGESVRISLSYDEFNDDGLFWEDKLDKVLADPRVEELQSLVIGAWEDVGSQDSEFIVELLVNNKDNLPNLRELFFGDIVLEESEVSWINHADMSPIIANFPKLTHFVIRGSNGLEFEQPIDHDNLRSLVIQCGGLPRKVVERIATGKMPNLEHLELWLGEDNYGGNCSMDDLRPIAYENLFPKLVFLGLKNSEVQDAIAELVANSPILKQIKILDLSMGTLSDKGGNALLASPDIKKLEFLDLQHHYLSSDMIKKFRSLGINVCVDDQQEAELNDDEIWRFVQVSE